MSRLKVSRTHHNTLKVFAKRQKVSLRKKLKNIQYISLDEKINQKIS